MYSGIKGSSLSNCFHKLVRRSSCLYCFQKIQYSYVISNIGVILKILYKFVNNNRCDDCLASSWNAWTESSPSALIDPFLKVVKFNSHCPVHSWRLRISRSAESHSQLRILVFWSASIFAFIADTYLPILDSLLLTCPLLASAQSECCFNQTTVPSQCYWNHRPIL